MFDRFSIGPLLLPISQELHVSLAATTGAATLYYLLYGVMQPVYGIISDRIGRVRVMRAAFAGMVVAELLSTLAPNLPFLVLSRAATGALAAAIVPTSLVYIGDTFAFRVRQQAILDFLAALAVGTTAATVGAGILARFASWRLAFALPGLISLILVVALRWMPESLGPRQGVGPTAQVMRVLGRRWALFLISLAVAEGAVILGFLTYLAPALEAHGQNPATAGLVVAAYGLSVLACTRIVKQLVVRMPAAGLIALGGSSLAVGYGIAAVSQAVAGILAASALAGAAYAFMHSTLQAWATDVVPEARGTATSLFVTGAFAGAAFGAAAVAGLAGAHRYTILFLVAALICIPVTVLGSVARSRYTSAGPPELPVGAA